MAVRADVRNGRAGALSRASATSKARIVKQSPSRRGLWPALASALLPILLAATAVPASAQTAYPSKPVRLVVAFAPGGNIDVPARIVAAKVTELWGVPLMVENKPGAGGSVGTDSVAKSAADGYTLAACSSATHAVNPALHRKLPYDSVADFTPISLIGTAPNVLLVPAASPIRTLADFIAQAKASPGKLSLGTAGIGSTQHFSLELLKAMTGTDITHVPYKGGSLALSDLLGGQIPATISGLPTAIGAIKAGKVRALAVTAPRRSPQLPDVPTVAESGLPGYEVVTWTGVCGPAGLPKPLVARLHADIARAVDAPETRRLLAEQGVDAASTTPEQLAALIRSEVARYAKLVKDAGIPQE